MAEFKLGRIRFIWKGPWVTGTTYIKDDIIRYGGKSYVCVIGHTASADFNTDLENDPTRWNLVSDGSEWKGDWNTTTFYKLNDIVKYGGLVYICKDSHTSASTASQGLETDQSKWDLYAEGFDWKGAWSPVTRYKINDLVKYGGQTYLCNLPHTSAATDTLGLEADQSKWDIYAETFDWKGNWVSATRYKVNDLVKYGGQTYVCNTGHTSAATDTLGLEADQSKWDYFHKGIEYKGTWSGLTVRYKVNDIVKYGADLWICITDHTSSTTFAEVNWAQFVEGLEFESSWNSSTIYQPGDIVTYGGFAYISKTNHSDETPSTSSTNWDLFTTGYKFQGDWSSATEYKVGDVIRLNGYTYVATADNTNQLPPNLSFWERLNSGFKWLGEWTSGTAYRLGDTVKEGVNSYTCILQHTSAAGNKPSVDTIGTYWNLLAAGAEAGVLTTQGDTLYYGGAGPTRLPIGAPGQVLKVTTGLAPTWEYFGVVDQVYYVALSGVDSPAPAYGITLDKPWKTIQYATQQIEKGPKFPNVKNLLERNRSYIQKEIIGWINAQITGNIAPFATGFTYDSAKCERDMGYIIDALAYDLSHGGNQRSRAAALQYVNNAPNVYSLGQKEETVAAINYGLTVIDAVVSNLAPATSYQGTVTRVADATKIEENGAQLILNALTQLITDAITAGVSTNIPAELKANYTIFVKTGIYYEVLPIVVPAETAIVGDELRSTNIRPAGTLVSQFDVPYSLAALQRIENVISNIVQNVSITRSTGNTLTQVTTRPAGSAAAGSAASALFNNARTYINFHVNASGSAPALTGSVTPTALQGFYDAVGVLEENKEFIVAEALAFINSTYTATCTATDTSGNITCNSTTNLVANMPVRFTGTTFGGITTNTTYYIKQVINSSTFTISSTIGGNTLTWSNASGSMTVTYFYNSASCARDVRSYVDAAKYDLIYTGNYETLMTARLYRRAVTGSLTEDMFYVRNGCGLRNATLQGLTGTLGVANVYGTQRPTAGAYVSLDPGWGPADSRTWVINKSCYVQNVTTFGTACVGLKIDGTLHNGGNRSVVANDFTQILSDGIGVWCTGTSALTELVSVFSYYGHIGYLAENGGKIRATNGNSSYGTFGCVSEGVDSTEVAITAFVDNRAGEAEVGTALTNGNQVFRLEYTNAGIDYTAASITINGAGTSAAVVADEFRDGGVYEIRLTDPSNTGSTGGTGYVTASNVAQGGTATAITLAATDSAISSAYVGMRVVIISGTGAGQYGYVNTYNAGSKIATILRESTGTAGWDHVVPGTPIASALDLTTNYIIEPRVTVAAPTYTNNTSTITSGTYPVGEMVYGDFVRTYLNVAPTGGSGTLATFTVELRGYKYYLTQAAGGNGYTVGNTLTIGFASVGGTSSANNITITVTGVNPANGAIASFTFTGTGRGGLYTGLNSTGAVLTSVDGITWVSRTGTGLAGSNTSIAYGVVNGVSYWVATNNAGSSTWTTDPELATSWSSQNGSATIPGGSSPNELAYGNGRFVAFNTSTGTTAYATTLLSWVAGPTLSGMSGLGGSIAYGGGRFVVLSASDTKAFYSLNGGVSWTSTTSQGASSGVTYGANKFVATNTATTTAMQYSLDGITWYASGLVPAQTRAAVEYGQGLFLAITSGSATAITSEDGVVWTSITLSGTLNWSQAALGNVNGVPRWAVIPQSSTTGNHFRNFVRAQARVKVTDGKLTQFRITEPGSGYTSAPTVTITDPNDTASGTWTVRVGNGVLANPSFTNRGTGYLTATGTITGNGYSDAFQPGTFVNVYGLTANPTPGSNIQFAGNDGYYKLVNVRNFVGTGPYIANFQISPPLTVFNAPAHATAITLKIKYSQVRLTGHDFLSIGTGNFTNTNYPGLPLQAADPEKETVESGGGRVFFTSTDQDGNFRVGDLFSVEQATGVATLNADAFNIAGLNELTLGAVALGGTGATITEFSTDPFFTADSDNIVPTQRAIKAYISSQIGGGGSSLNVNTLTAGQIYVAGDSISTTTGFQINVLNKMNFTGGVDGIPVAMNFFLLG